MRMGKVIVLHAVIRRHRDSLQTNQSHETHLNESYYKFQVWIGRSDIYLINA